MAFGFGCSASKVACSHAIWISYIFDSAISLDSAKRCLDGKQFETINSSCLGKFTVLAEI